MNNYRFSKKRTVLLILNLLFCLIIYYFGNDKESRGLVLAVSVLCFISLYDNLFNENK